MVNLQKQNFLGSQKINIPKVIKKIPDYAFDGCASLSNLGLHDQVTEIGKYAFRGCSKIANTLNIPASVVTIMEGAFQKCTEITKVTFGAAKQALNLLADASVLTTIGDLAFDECSKLAEVDLPDKLATIGSGSFQGTAIKTIVVPASVTAIGDNCFKGCKSLETFEYLGTTEIKNNIFADTNPTIKLPDSYPSKSFGGKDLNPDNGLGGGAIAGIVIAVIADVAIITVLVVLGVKGKLNCQKKGFVNA